MDAASRLEREFAARVGGPRDDQPGALVGIEQEFTVHTPTAERADFRTLLRESGVVGSQLDPNDPNAWRTPSGVVVTADGREAEAATPPVSVQPGFTGDVSAWARAARREVEAVLLGSHSVRGYSTHLSISVDDRRNPRVGALYARTFAPGLMLLVDRVDSPGLIIRPRPGRLELCGEFVDGPWLRAAAVYAAGSVLACHQAIRSDRAFASLPPQLEVGTRPASTRAGWWVDRAAFGVDLLQGGRSARLRRCDGRRVRAQAHLEAAWRCARTALGPRVAPEDLATADELVNGDGPLPSETDGLAVERREPGPLPPPSPLGQVGIVRARAGFVVEAFAATWKLTIFRLRARDRARDAYAAIPRADHARFFELLDAGELDGVIGSYLALAPSGRPVAMTNMGPALGDVAPSAAAIGDRELDQRLTATLPSSTARALKYGAPIVGQVPFAERRGCLPGTKWLIAGGVAIALVIAGVVVALSGGGGESGSKRAGSAAGPSGAASNGVRCGKNATGAVIEWSVISTSCEVAARYPYDATPFEQATVEGTEPTDTLVFGSPCAIHDATTKELDDNKDPTNGFVGRSLIGVPIAGLPPGALVEVVLTAPDGTTLRTGRAIADGQGYAAVLVPINVPQTHTITSARYFPGGNASGAPVAIAPTSISADGSIKAALPGNRCDRDATLDLVQPNTGANDSNAAATSAVTTGASAFALFGAYATPGATLDLRGPWTVTPEDSYFGVKGGNVELDVWAGTNRGTDPKGEVPAFVRYYSSAIIYPTTAGTAEAWDAAFPCGAGQLAWTVCGKERRAFSERSLVKLGAVFDRPIPLMPASDAKYSFAVGDQTVDLVAHGGTWTISGLADARAVIRNNAVFVVAPFSEVGSGAYRISTAAGSRHDVQPPANREPIPIGTTIAANGVPGKETAAQFLASLSTALTNGDAKFLRERLHPAVIDRYGAAPCDAFAASAHAPADIVLNQLGPPSTYAWQTDGLTRDVPDTNTVPATESGRPVTVHIALVEGTWRWFTDCGTPATDAR